MIEWVDSPKSGFVDEYEIIDGQCPDLPGYFIGTTPIEYDPAAGPGENPFSTTSLTGTLQNVGTSGFNPIGYICGDARNKGPQVCKNKRRLFRTELETVFIAELREILLSPQLMELIFEKTRKKIKEASSRATPSIAQLKKQKHSIATQLQNLLDFVQGGEALPSIRDRIGVKERELDSIEQKLSKIAVSPYRTQKLTINWIQDKMVGLKKLLCDSTDDYIKLRNALRQIFPDKLEVGQLEVDGGVKFTIKGNASPLNFLMAGNLPLCMASPGGFNTKGAI